MIAKKDFMKTGYDRSYVYRDSQGRMISDTVSKPKTKTTMSSKKVMAKKPAVKAKMLKKATVKKAKRK